MLLLSLLALKVKVEEGVHHEARRVPFLLVFPLQLLGVRHAPKLLRFQLRLLEVFLGDLLVQVLDVVFHPAPHVVSVLRA